MSLVINGVTLGPKDVVHCETEQEAIEICNLLHKMGERWCNGRSYEKETRWHDYEDKICYNVCHGSFASIHFYSGQGMNIVKAKDILSPQIKENISYEIFGRTFDSLDEAQKFRQKVMSFARETNPEKIAQMLDMS